MSYKTKKSKPKKQYPGEKLVPLGGGVYFEDLTGPRTPEHARKKKTGPNQVASHTKEELRRARTGSSGHLQYPT